VPTDSELLISRKGIPMEAEKVKRVRKYIDHGYAEYKNGILSLTEDGFWISNAIIGEVLA
ncbi:MAG: hypothetical protein II377_01330, partial [Clostridia bacterium]|nr:hypothetical protein [Clostridia bacterium]